MSGLSENAMQTPGDGAATAILASWRRNFFTLWSGQAASLFGSAVVQFTLVWWLTVKTGSATALAIATACALVPAVVLGPLTGVAIDRYNRKLVMLVTDSLVAGATLLLAYFFWAGTAQVWHVYAALLFRNAAGAFQAPAMNASTTLMVPLAQLSRIAGFNQMLQGLTGIAAPALGAVLYSLLPMPAILMLDVATALLGVLALALVRMPQPPRTQPSSATSFFADLRDGFLYLARWPGMLTLLLTLSFFNLLVVPAAALMPILVTQHFGGGVVQLATMQSCFSAGVLGGGLLLAAWGGFAQRILTILLGLLLFGAGLLGIGLLPASAYWPATVFAFFLAATTGLISGPFMSLLQASVAPHMQGRVFGLVGSIIACMAPLALFVAGPVADALGVIFWYVSGGIGAMLVAAALYFMPSVRAVERRGF